MIRAGDRVGRSTCLDRLIVGRQRRVTFSMRCDCSATYQIGRTSLLRNVRAGLTVECVACRSPRRARHSTVATDPTGRGLTESSLAIVVAVLTHERVFSGDLPSVGKVEWFLKSRWTDRRRRIGHLERRGLLRVVRRVGSCESYLEPTDLARAMVA